MPAAGELRFRAVLAPLRRFEPAAFPLRDLAEPLRADDRPFIGLPWIREASCRQISTLRAGVVLAKLMSGLSPRAHSA